MSPIGAGRTVFIYELSMIFMALIGALYCSRAPIFVLELLILLEFAAEALIERVETKPYAPKN